MRHDEKSFVARATKILTGRPSNGRIEGTNNLRQDLRRKAHGFTNYADFEARGIFTT